MSLLECKLQIKEWEKKFSAAHGRVPSRADVKADEAIWKAYKMYNSMKKSQPNGKRVSGKAPSDSKPKESSSGTLQEKPEKAEHNFEELKSSIDSLQINIVISDDEERLDPVQNAELGPTPQANGKVLSMFELMISPPESSPLRRNESPLKRKAQEPFKTPTKAVTRINLADLTPSRGSLADKLRMASSPARAVTPKSSANDAMETPAYLGKINNKFSLSESGRHSLESSPSKVFETPRRSRIEENFQVSPSPLKSQRYLSFGASKKVSDIFQVLQSLNQDEEFQSQKLQIEQELAELSQKEVPEQEPQLNPQELKRRKKATTQKRTTRRWKIKPRSEGALDDVFDGKDVHEEIYKMENAERTNLLLYMESALEDESTEEDEEPLPRKAAPSTKINPVSNNYQRLKINDPRAKKFKQRMKRR